MNKPSEFTLMAYLDHQLNEAERRQVEIALRRDPELRDQLERLQETDALVQSALSEALTTPMPPIRGLETSPADKAEPHGWASWWAVLLRPQAAVPLVLVLALGFTAGGWFGQDRAWQQAQQRYAEASLLDPETQVLARKVLNQTLETQLSGKTATWEQPGSQGRGSVTPVRTYKTEQGVYCREFVEQVHSGQAQIRVQGVACRMGEGWKLRSQTIRVL